MHLGFVGFSGGGGESDDLDGRRACGFGCRLLAVGRRLRRAVVEQLAVAGAIRQLGWRVYATNAPSAQLSLSQAVRAYRSEYLVERDMGRLKGRPLSLTPLDLERDDHVTGLIRLLSVGLRVLTLVV